ncbi:hypothetical protein [Rhodococcus rhodnii]|uniref:hypothetical protein n=1 Tax=Rhodococcus rhodnii TaxID=38312 RepID=UPI0009FA7604|nr:hypothetical protein [Rhodococcus rhodnii]
MTAAVSIDEFDDLPRRARIVGAQIPPAQRCAPIWDGPVRRGEHTPHNPMVWLLGASGGVGVSSLTRSIAYAGDCGRAWPSRIGPREDSPLIVIVARTTMHSLRHAHDLLLQHGAGATPEGTTVLGVAAVADSDRPLSTPIRSQLHVLSSLAGALWHVPWIEPWRVLEPHALPEWGPNSVPAAAKKRWRGGEDVAHTPPPPVIELYHRIQTAAHERITAMTHGKDTTR